VLADLVPGGFGREITAPTPPACCSAFPRLAAWTPSGATPKAKLAAAVSASGTTLMEVFGVGPDRALLTAARTYQWSARSSA
jgi:hypothetical protein